MHWKEKKDSNYLEFLISGLNCRERESEREREREIVYNVVYTKAE